MPTINVRDTKLHYEMAGEGEPPLIFIHGMCSGGWGWAYQLARLSPEFSCVAYDRRGHSRSEQGEEDQSDRAHVDDLAALIETLDLDRPVLVGSSGGAVIALEFVRRYPDRVRGAVLMEPPVFSLDPETSQGLLAEMVPQLQQAVGDGGPRKAVDVFYQVICGSYWAQLDDAGKERTLDNAHLLFPTLEREAVDITAADLAKIETPALVIGGTASPPFLRSLNRTLAEHLPNARFIEIEGSGHVVYAEKPDEFAQAVRVFVHEVSGVLTGSTA